MYRKLLILFISSVLLLLVGCSKEAKDEAAKMEQEMLGDTLQMEDSAAMVDTAAEIAVDSNTPFEATAIPEEESAKKMPKQPAGEGYTVQVAGCENRDYAEYLVEKYTSRGYEPFVTTISVEGQTYYRVRIGIFETMTEAKALQAELSDRYSITSWIDITINNY